MAKTVRYSISFFLCMVLPCVLTVFSCSRGSGVTVHIAGFSDDTRTGTCDALYWKNGADDVTMLNTRPHNGAVSALFVSGTNVYMGGFENHGGDDIATYWKNGKAFALSTGETNGAAERVESICADGERVYAAGWRREGKISTAMYWIVERGGRTVTVSSIPLTDGTRNAGAFAVAVSGGDVYVGGIEYAGDNAVAKYWKNGARAAYVLSDGRYPAGVHEILVHNGDVYAAGWEQQNGIDVAKYWINSQRNFKELSDGRFDARIAALAIRGEDVYAVGFEGNGRKPVARYWKNEEGFPLAGGETDTFARALFVHERDGKRSVYIAGYGSNGLFERACFWRIDATGLHTILLGEENMPSKACAIAVIEG